MKSSAGRAVREEIKMSSYYFFAFLVIVIAYIGGAHFGSLLWKRDKNNDNK